MTSTYCLKSVLRRMAEDDEGDASRYEALVIAVNRRAERMAGERGRRFDQFWAAAAAAYGRIAESAGNGRLADDAKGSATDAAQRGALMLDILRERADLDAKHEAAGTPPVLIYDDDVILDGKTLSGPSNQVLLKIRSPEGVAVDERKRPCMIVDSRAGHGASRTHEGSAQDEHSGPGRPRPNGDRRRPSVEATKSETAFGAVKPKAKAKTKEH